MGANFHHRSPREAIGEQLVGMISSFQGVEWSGQTVLQAPEIDNRCAALYNDRATFSSNGRTFAVVSNNSQCQITRIRAFARARSRSLFISSVSVSVRVRINTFHLSRKSRTASYLAMRHTWPDTGLHEAVLVDCGPEKL